MKVYVWADVEGVAGVIDWDDPVSDTHFNAENRARVRRFFTAEVNACVQGARAAGAELIVVKDSHGAGNNLYIEDLDEDCEAILGSKGLPDPWADLDESFDVGIIIGAHPMSGTAQGILPHTLYEINGKPMGDAALFAAVCGSYDVPVAFASGDRAAMQQLVALLPGLRTVASKRAYSPYAARTLAPAKVQKLIRSGVQDALRNLENAPVLHFDRPYKVKFYAGEGEGDDLASTFVNLLKARGAPYGSQDVEPERSRHLRRLKTARKAGEEGESSFT